MLFLKLIETLIIPGAKRGDIHPLAESMVQTSRVDWSAEEHFKPHPWPGANLKGLLLCPPRCQECVPINLGVIIITTKHPQHQQFFLWSVPSNQHHHFGMKVWQDPEWLLTWRAADLVLPKRLLMNTRGNTREPRVSFHCGQDSNPDIYVLVEVLTRRLTSSLQKEI